jgi:uncharacterized membrane protein
LSARHIAIVLLLGTGSLVAALGLFNYFHRSSPEHRSRIAPAGSPQGKASSEVLYPVVLFLILLAAFLLRLEGIDLRGMSHVEVYIPGINLPPLVSQPPPRLDFLTMLSWHWHDEPHPQGYYILMFFWAKLFGTSLASIRFPSILFGIGAVALVYALASRACDRRVGLIAATLLAFNGHHIYWSQNARMYSMACFLGLASAYLLFVMLQQSRRRPGLEAGYVAVTLLGLFTQLFFWVLLAAQMLLALVYSSHDAKRVSRIFSLQVLVAILGSPLWAHAVYRSRPIDLGGPTLAFIQDYLNFGFLFLPDYFSSSLPRDVSPSIELFATFLALTCLIVGMMNRSNRLRLDPPGEPIDAWKRLVPVAGGFVLIIAGLALLAWQRQAAIAFTALVPVVALSALPLLSRVWSRVRLALGSFLSPRWSADNAVLLFMVLGLLPALLLSVVSIFKTMMIARGFLLFVPFLLVVQAAGVDAIMRRRVLALPLLAALVAIHLYSVDYYRKVPGPNDYRGLAQQMTDRMQPDDLIFVFPRDWVTTPLFYYFQDRPERIIAGNYAEALAAHPAARVWVPLFADYREMSDGMREPLKHYTVIDRVSSHNCAAELYQPGRE